MNSIAIPDQEITTIRTKATKGSNAARDLIIISDEDMVKASDLLGNIKLAFKGVTQKKKEITDPMSNALAKVRDLFRPIESSLLEAEGVVKGKMIGYQREVDRKAAEELAAIEVKVDKQEMTFAAANEAAAEIQVMPTIVESKKGSVIFREVQVVEVISEAIIPREYLVLDMVKIRKAALAGVLIPGVVVKTEKQVAGKY